MRFNFTLHSPFSEVLALLAIWKAAEIGAVIWRHRTLRPVLHWDRGWPCQPHRDPSWKTGHKYDWKRDMQAWPWWKLGFDLVRLGVVPPAFGWGFWIYSARGARRIDFYLSNRRVPATI